MVGAEALGVGWGGGGVEEERGWSSESLVSKREATPKLMAKPQVAKSKTKQKTGCYFYNNSNNAYIISDAPS